MKLSIAGRRSQYAFVPSAEIERTAQASPEGLGKPCDGIGGVWKICGLEARETIARLITNVSTGKRNPRVATGLEPLLGVAACVTPPASDWFSPVLLFESNVCPTVSPLTSDKVSQPFPGNTRRFVLCYNPYPGGELNIGELVWALEAVEQGT
jgi:hypothetical protein